MLTLLFVLASVVLQAPAEIPDLTAPEVTVSIRPSSLDPYQLLRRRTPETFTCRADVRQADSGPVYLSGELVLRPGESNTLTTSMRDYTLDFAVSMKKQRAETIVTVRRGDKILTRQRSTMVLQTPDGVVPLR